MVYVYFITATGGSSFMIHSAHKFLKNNMISDIIKKNISKVDLTK